MTAFRSMVVVISLLVGTIAFAMSAKEKAAVQQAKITVHQAIAIALLEAPGGLLIDADAATVDGKVSYGIEILKDSLYDIRIDMHGSVLRVFQRRVHSKDWKGLAGVDGYSPIRGAMALMRFPRPSCNGHLTQLTLDRSRIDSSLEGTKFVYGARLIKALKRVLIEVRRDEARDGRNRNGGGTRLGMAGRQARGPL
jgi:hypothetical protein